MRKRKQLSSDFKEILEYQGVPLQANAVPVGSPSEDLDPANLHWLIAASWPVLKCMIIKYLWQESVSLKTYLAFWFDL